MTIELKVNIPFKIVLNLTDISWTELQKEIIIKNDWAYCPLCGDCLFDIQIQDENHWIFTLPKVIKEYKEGAK